MPSELVMLSWTLVLALVQILLPATFRTGETGLAYNTGPRDVPSPVPPRIVTARLMRAQHNLFETLPLFIAAVLIAHVASLDGPLTYWGTLIYFWARLVYVPLYVLSIKYVRSMAWAASVAGLVMIFCTLFHNI
jgi:uncharacterized MAPEG superfamily protein